VSNAMVLPLKGRTMAHGEIYPDFLTFFYDFLQLAYKSQFSTDLDDVYVKTRVSMQGCAFWGLRYSKTIFG
jgi:hypothetical protein